VRGLSAGRAAMWTIAAGIVLAVLAVLAIAGLDGFPGEWAGIAIAAVLAGVAFGLGFYE
jgi:hypothetical protein